jgi:phage terminase large subunit-like protein
VKRINQSGKSKRLGKGHQTRTRRHLGKNVNVSANVSRNRYAAARLVAAAHKQSHTYDEMKGFIERARAPSSIKLLALHRIKTRYPDFGK